MRRRRPQIGHVLSGDVVRFARRLIEKQKEGLSKLTDIVLARAAEDKTTNPRFVRLATGVWNGTGGWQRFGGTGRLRAMTWVL